MGCAETRALKRGNFLILTAVTTLDVLETEVYSAGKLDVRRRRTSLQLRCYSCTLLLAGELIQTLPLRRKAGGNSGPLAGVNTCLGASFGSPC